MDRRHTDVRPVTIYVGEHNTTYQGAGYVIEGERRYYLVGKRPRFNGETCFVLSRGDLHDLSVNKYDWYIGGYHWRPGSRRTVAHPFGNHWLMVPWVIPGDDDSKIDDNAEYQYRRIEAYLREY